MFSNIDYIIEYIYIYIQNDLIFNWLSINYTLSEYKSRR